jgi:hypothetical protein
MTSRILGGFSSRCARIRPFFRLLKDRSAIPLCPCCGEEKFRSVLGNIQMKPVRVTSSSRAPGKCFARPRVSSRIASSWRWRRKAPRRRRGRRGVPLDHGGEERRVQVSPGALHLVEVGGTAEAKNMPSTEPSRVPQGESAPPSLRPRAPRKGDALASSLGTSRGVRAPRGWRSPPPWRGIARESPRLVDWSDRGEFFHDLPASPKAPGQSAADDLAEAVRSGTRGGAAYAPSGTRNP